MDENISFAIFNIPLSLKKEKETDIWLKENDASLYC